MLLNENPFYLLGASTRDGRHRIVELAEEKSLYLDQALCSRCSADLINPRQRLQSEVAWVPGVSPARLLSTVEAALKGAPADPLPSPLAQVNVLVTKLAHEGTGAHAHLGARLLEVAEAWDRVEPEHVRVLVNEDRTAAGFAAMEGTREVERALQGRMDAIRSVLVKVLRGCPEEVQVQALTEALDQGTASGTVPGPVLLHALIDALSMDLHGALERERATVESALVKVRSAAAAGQDTLLDAAVDSLTSAVRGWDRYAQALQLSAKSRGQDHEASREMAGVIRSLAVDLHNEHTQTRIAQRITELSQEVFAEVPRAAEIAQEDLDKLEEIIEEGEAAEEQRAILREMQPISAAPTLYTINGIGTKLYGRRGMHAASGTYVATLYFVVLFVPVMPLRCYRVRDGEGGGWHFIGRVPFSQNEKIHAWGVAAALALWMFVSAVGGEPDRSYASQPSTRPSAAVQELLQSSPVASAAEAPREASQTRNAAEPTYYGAGSRFTRDRLERWIEAERERIHRIESDLSATTEQLKVLSAEVDRKKRKVESYDGLATDGALPESVYDEYQVDLRRYNNLVDEYNSVLEAYKTDRASYQNALDAVNDSIDRYNQMR